MKWSKAHRKMVQLQNHRRTVYRMLRKQNDGIVPCFVCGRHVKPHHATLEHKIPLSKGGTEDMENLAISHNGCNTRRGNRDIEEYMPARALLEMVP